MFIWLLSTSTIGSFGSFVCNKACKIDEFLNIKNCSCEKRN